MHEGLAICEFIRGSPGTFSAPAIHRPKHSMQPSIGGRGDNPSAVKDTNQMLEEAFRNSVRDEGSTTIVSRQGLQDAWGHKFHKPGTNSCCQQARAW